MKLDAIVLRLRLASTTFGQKIAGAASLQKADLNALKDRMPIAFIFETAQSAQENQAESSVVQTVEEHFAIQVYIKNVTDEPGAEAFNTLDDIRQELLDSLLGWIMPGYHYPIEYVSGVHLAASHAYLVYQFNFKSSKRINADNLPAASSDDFLRIYGIDQHLTNPNFDTDSDWSKGDGWTIGSGVASCDGTQAAASNLSQNIASLQQIPYRIKFSIKSRSAGAITPILGGQAGTTKSAVGNYEEIITAGSADTLFILQADSDFVGSVDAAHVGAGYGVDIDGTGFQEGDVEAEVTVDLPGP